MWKGLHGGVSFSVGESSLWNIVLEDSFKKDLLSYIGYYTVKARLFISVLNIYGENSVTSGIYQSLLMEP